MGALTLDILGHVRTHLLTELNPTNDADIATRIRPDWTGGRLVRLGRPSGAVFDFANTSAVEHAIADISVQVYGTDSDDVWEYAGDVFDAVMALASTSEIRVAGVSCISAPAGVPDTSRPDPLDRVVMTFAVTYHTP